MNQNSDIKSAMENFSVRGVVNGARTGKDYVLIENIKPLKTLRLRSG